MTDERIKKSLDNAKTVLTRLVVDKQIADKKPETTKTQTEVESIIAGQYERENWVKVNQFVNESVPIPGPADDAKAPIPGYHNMVGPNLEHYWRTTPGKRAIVKLQERVGKGLDPVTAVADDDMREHLAMLDIEAVYSRHTKDLKAFYTALEYQRRKNVGGPLSSRPMVRRMSGGRPIRPQPHERARSSNREELKPEGWVVEVRGYTYWHRRRPTRRVHRRHPAAEHHRSSRKDRAEDGDREVRRATDQREDQPRACTLRRRRDKNPVAHVPPFDRATRR